MSLPLSTCNLRLPPSNLSAMTEFIPDSLAIIAGNGSYPTQLAKSARHQGVSRLFAVAFKKETEGAIAEVVDEVAWVRLGSLQDLLGAIQKSGIKHAVMAGQLTPTSLYHVRFDTRALALLSRLKERNAHSIFGAVAEELLQIGVQLLPAHMFMQTSMLQPGLITKRPPTEQEQSDILLGRRVAKATSSLNVGQTVVIKEGTILAVEAFEGTDDTIKRAAKLGGPGVVVVKVAKPGHDMRFDIPVVGRHTIKLLKKTRASVLAVEAGRTILLDRDKVVAEADKLGITLTAVEAEPTIF